MANTISFFMTVILSNKIISFENQTGFTFFTTKSIVTLRSWDEVF